MNKSIDERLFEQLMRAHHGLHRGMMKAHGSHGHGQHCHGKHGEEGRGPNGHHCGQHGPHGHHGMEGHGHHGMADHGPHGPMGPGRGHRMRAFAQERLLRTLASYEEGIHQKELVESMKINPSSVSELISKLEGEGYVTRTVDPQDKRATLITLTEVGRARAYELEDERNERFSTLFAGLSEEEKEQLVNLLEKFNDNQDSEGEEEAE